MLLNTLFKHWSYQIFAPGTIIREKYEAFKLLLRYDGRCHEQMAELQRLLHGFQQEDLSRIRKRFTLFSEQVLGMINCLNTMAPGSYVSLKEYHKKFDFYGRFLLAPPAIDVAPPYALPLEQIRPDTPNIGSKAINLAILKNTLDAPVPNGFAITANSFHYLVEYNNLRTIIDDLLSELNIESTHSLNWISEQLQKIIKAARIPPAIDREMTAAYQQLEQAAGRTVLTAVRSSAISEDGSCSFAGQYTTLLRVGRGGLAAAYLDVLASKYSPEALFYRVCQGLGDEETAMSVLVLEMVNAVSSGVLYTRAPVQTGTLDDMLHLHVIPGLGEALVGGQKIPDQYIMSREKQPQLLQVTANEPVITDNQAQLLGKWGLTLEQQFKTPQDIEWAIGPDKKLLFLQTRPLHISVVPAPGQTERKKEDGTDHVVLLENCEGAAGGRAAGKVFRYDSSRGMTLDDIPTDAVLVCKDTPPAFVQIINRLAAVIAEQGSQASHFATVAREFGIPFLAGTGDKANLLQNCSMITVDGDLGTVFQGKVAGLTCNTDKEGQENQYYRTLRQVLKFISPLELTDPAADNFRPEGCRSMHDLIRFCHEKALQAMFSAARPGTGRGALKLVADLPLDVFLFNVGKGFSAQPDGDGNNVQLSNITSIPFTALWSGLSHPDVQWKKKAFDWDAYDKIELAGGVAPAKDSFDFASYAIIGADYLHFNIRFGYHFTIIDVLCGEATAENYCMMRFAGGGGDYDSRSLRIDFITQILVRLEFVVDKKGDLLEAKLGAMESRVLCKKLDMLGRLLGATKLMDMVLTDKEMVNQCVEDFFNGRYSFSQEG
jgi:pyruvate,water dikinase